MNNASSEREGITPAAKRGHPPRHAPNDLGVACRALWRALPNPSRAGAPRTDWLQENRWVDRDHGSDSNGSKISPALLVLSQAIGTFCLYRGTHTAGSSSCEPEGRKRIHVHIAAESPQVCLPAQSRPLHSRRGKSQEQHRTRSIPYEECEINTANSARKIGNAAPTAWSPCRRRGSGHRACSPQQSVWPPAAPFATPEGCASLPPRPPA